MPLDPTGFKMLDWEGASTNPTTPVTNFLGATGNAAGKIPGIGTIAQAGIGVLQGISGLFDAAKARRMQAEAEKRFKALTEEKRRFATLLKNQSAGIRSQSADFTGLNQGLGGLNSATSAAIQNLNNSNLSQGARLANAGMLGLNRARGEADMRSQFTGRQQARMTQADAMLREGYQAAQVPLQMEAEYAQRRADQQAGLADRGLQSGLQNVTRAVNNYDTRMAYNQQAAAQIEQQKQLQAWLQRMGVQQQFSTGGFVEGVDRGVDEVVVKTRPGEMIISPEDLKKLTRAKSPEKIGKLFMDIYQKYEQKSSGKQRKFKNGGIVKQEKRGQYPDVPSGPAAGMLLQQERMPKKDSKQPKTKTEPFLK